MRVEEEQAVLPARSADRTAECEAVVALLGNGLRNIVGHVGPRVRIPFGVALQVVDRAAELVGAALGHPGNLQAARTAIFGLVGRREHLDLGDGVHVELNALPVAARVDVGDAVEQEVRRATAETRDGGVRASGRDSAGDSRYERGKRREVTPRIRKIFHLSLRNGVGPLARLRLDHRSVPRYQHGLGECADLEIERGNDRAVAGADGDSPAFYRLEPVHRHSDRVCVTSDVREHEIASRAGHRLEAGATRLADEGDRRAGNDATLIIFHVARNRRGGLRGRER
jgi:hypothetical protein